MQNVSSIITVFNRTERNSGVCQENVTSTGIPVSSTIYTVISGKTSYTVQ